MFLKKSVKELKKEKLALIGILIMSLIIIKWFRGNEIINSNDANWPITPQADFIRSTFSWWNRGLGFSNVRGLALGPLFTFPQAMFSSFGFPIQISQEIIFYCLLSISGISMYFLMRRIILEGRSFSTASSLVSANLYMFNMFVLQIIYQPLLITWLYLYALLPLIFLFFIKSLEHKRYIAVLGILFFLASPTGDNITDYISLVLLIIIYVVFSALFLKRNKGLINITLTTIYAAGIFILVNAFWLIPSIILSLQEYSQWLLEIGGSVILSYTNFGEMFRFLGWWSFTANYKGSPYFPYYSVYYSIGFIIIGYLIPLLAFSSLLLSKKSTYTLFFTLVGLIGLFFQKGEIPPLAAINTWLYTHIPGFLAFDGPKFFILYVISIAALLGISLQALLERLHNNFKLTKSKLLIIVILFLLIINIYAFPFWTGEIYPSYQNSVLPSAHIRIPSYYIQLADYINNQTGNFKILGLPEYEGGVSLWVPYTWGYLGIDPLFHYLNNAYLLPNNYQGGMYTLLYQTIKQENIPYLISLASLLGVKYIIVRNDVNISFYGNTISPQIITKLLQNQSGISYVRSFGELDLYEINESSNQEIYAATNVISVNQLNLLPYLSNDHESFAVNSLILVNQILPENVNTSAIKFLLYSASNISLNVLNGNNDPINWSNFVAGDYEARYYPGWKGVVDTNGQGSNDMLIFGSTNECPYIFPSFSNNGWAAFNSTLVYLKTGNTSLVITGISSSGGSSDAKVVGVWWMTGWLGMSTRLITFPIVIPPHQNTIIQINQELNNLTLDVMPQISNVLFTGNIPHIKFKEINPTYYLVHVNSTQPFFIIFGESYAPQWISYLNGKQLPDHMVADGYANAWYVNNTGALTIKIRYEPQQVFMVSSIISAITLLALVIIIFGILGVDPLLSRGHR